MAYPRSGGPPMASMQSAWIPRSMYEPSMPWAGGPLKMKTDFDKTVEKDLNSDPGKKTVWHVYNEKSSKEDEAFLKGISEGMDVLLIFAGLFSATAAAFLQFTLPLLQDDSQNTTNQLLLSIFHKLENSSYPLPTSSTFNPEPNAIVVNCLIFAAIAGSLTAAFFAILTKQWVRSIRAGLDTIENQSSRARTRQFRLDGVKDWHFADMAALLPVLLHGSLALFGIGVVDFLWLTDEKVLSAIIMVILAIGTLVYVALSIAPLQSPRAPFWSPLTTILDLLRAGISSAYHKVKSFVLRERLASTLDLDRDKRYGEKAPVSRLVASDKSIDVEVIISLLNSADQATEISILYASLRELQELSLRAEDPNLFNRSIIFSTWSYLAKTCLYNGQPPILIPGKEDRARFLCQILEWLGTLTRHNSLNVKFKFIIDEGKQLARAIFNYGFKNGDIRDMIIGHLARITINHMEQVRIHECRLCIDSSSGRAEAIEGHLRAVDPRNWDPAISPEDGLTRRQREGKWVIHYITAQTRCLWHFSPRDPPSRQARSLVKSLINKFGLGDPKIVDEWRSRRLQAPIMRDDVDENHVSLWMEIIRKARERSRDEIRGNAERATMQGGPPRTYGYPPYKDYRNISPPRTWSPSSSRSPSRASSRISSAIDSRAPSSPRDISPVPSLRGRTRGRSPIIIAADREPRSPSYSPEHRFSRSPRRRSRSPRPAIVVDRSSRSAIRLTVPEPHRNSARRRFGRPILSHRHRRQSSSRSPTPVIIRSRSRSPPPVIIVGGNSKKRAHFGSPSEESFHPAFQRHERDAHISRPRSPRRRATYDSERFGEESRSRMQSQGFPIWKTTPLRFPPRAKFIGERENSNPVPDDNYTALFNLYMISDSIVYAAVVISPAPGLELKEPNDTWKQVAYRQFEHITGTSYSEDLEEVPPSLQYALITTQTLPVISDDNGVAVPADDFIPHISAILDRLGVGFHVRQEFIKANAEMFLAKTWIIYRFMPPDELAGFVDIAVSLSPCNFKRIFLLFKEVSAVEATLAHGNTDTMVSELNGQLGDVYAVNELFEIGLMDCTSKIIAPQVVDPYYDDE